MLFHHSQKLFFAFKVNMGRQKQAAGKLGLTHRNGMSAGFVLHALLVRQFLTSA